MKNFKYSLIMWIPFVLLFALAGFGLEALEGNKIATTEYMGLRDLGILYLFFAVSLAFIFYVISFLPLTLVVSKFVKALLFKVVIFTIGGGVIGAFAFEKIYSSRFIEEYNLSIISAILIFSIAGLLYSLIENSVKRNIKFI